MKDDIVHEITKYFQESVVFDFKKNTINSYAQLQNLKEVFFSLLDADAFSALLHDGLSYDNQLEDIFTDIFEAGLGIHKFCDNQSRIAPRPIITYFLNIPKYQYHKNDISKVYFAFNVWLEFFGADKIEPEWINCPFCKSRINGGICSNKSCKKRMADSITASSELAMMLEEERAGRPTPTPSYWDAICSGSEFFLDYKREIEAYREKRTRETRLKEETNRQLSIKQANEELDRLSSLVQIESSKETPDFDSILSVLSTSKVINDVLGFKDKSFSKKVNELKRNVESAKKEHQKKQEKVNKQKEFDESIIVFLKNFVLLEQELTLHTQEISKLKVLFEETNQSYAIIVSGLKNGYVLEAGAQLTDYLKKYKEEIRSLVAAYILKTDHDLELFEKQKQLIVKVNYVINLFTGVHPSDDKSKEIGNVFINEIECNTLFDTFRLERKSQYDEIVNPIRQKLDELIKAEKETKLKEFVLQTDSFIEDIDDSLPQESLSETFQTRLLELKNNTYFDSIVTNGEYIRRINIIKEKILLLENQEHIYWEDVTARKTQKRKRAKRRRKAGLVAVILMVCMALAVFLCEFSGVIPINLFLASSNGNIKGTISNGGVIIEKYDISQKNITIPQTTRLSWQIEQCTINKIASNAFSGNTVVETIELPSTIDKIESKAFLHCSSLRRITLNSIQPPIIEEDSFDSSAITFYVPETSYNAYLQDEKWSVLSNNIFPNYNNDINQVTILFDENGGADVNDLISIAINSTIEEIPIPTRFGYAFLGWYYMEDNKEKLFDAKGTVLNESKKLIAKWSIGNYKITFDYSGGEGSVKSKTVIYNELYGMLPQTTRNGYTFNGWYLNDQLIDGKTKVAISFDETLVAAWIPNNYTVSLDYQDEITAKNTKIIAFDSEYGELPNPQREGYVFSGWHYGDAIITSKNIMSISEDHTLLAEWKPIEYKIVYQVNGGIFSVLETNCTYDKAFNVSSPTREGYYFSGWKYKDTIFKSEDTIKNLTSIPNETIEFIAMWEPRSNTLNYDANGGIGTMLSSTIETDSSLVLPKNQFTRKGYIFKGWSETKNGEIDYYDESRYVMGPKSSYILYAIWSAESYKLEYKNIVNNQIIDTKTIIAKTDENLVLSNSFVQDGYTLLGWGIDIDEISYEVDSTYKMPANDVILYTIWKPNENIIIFNANGGVGNMSQQIISSDRKALLISNSYTKLGYAFKGWSSCYDGDVEYLDCSEYSMGIKQENYLYAVWQKEIYEILYALNGGANNDLNPTSYSVDSDHIILLSPSRAGYKFVHWCKDEALTIEEDNIPLGSTGDKVFYAKWQANTNILSFNSNGGTGDMDDIQMLTDTTQELPMNKFVRLGYTFIGWKKTPSVDEGATYADSALFTMGAESNNVIYATWSLNYYSISYELNGGLNNINNPTNYTIESEQIELERPSRKGYTFVAWCTDISLINTVENIEEGSYGDKVLYAKWNANLNTIHFDANGGTGTMQDVQMATGESNALPNNTFVKNGYSFVGWKQSLDINEGAAYVNKEIYHMGEESEYTLYAVWNVIIYYITYETNGGDNHHLNPLTYTIDSNDIELYDASRTGYSFVSWYSDSSFTSPVSAILHGSNGNINLYAAWHANANTLHFNANGGIGTMEDENVASGATIVLPANTFYKDGSKFAGWSTSQGGTSIYGDQVAYTMGTKSEVTLFAVWAQTQFTIQYNLNGGTNSTANPTGYNTEAATIILANPTKTGNTFVGWYTESSFKNKITQITTGSTQNYYLYAKWTKNSYIVTFNYNGGSGSPASKMVTYSENYGSLPSASKTGNTFVGWYYNDSLITSTSDVIIVGNHTLTAKYTTNSYLVSFNMDGGTGSATQKRITYGEKYGALPTISKTGYSFGGWYYNGTRITENTIMNIASNHILSPQWTKNTYTVTFNYNGGSGNTTTKQVTYDDKYGTLPTASRTGHTYKWYYNNTIITESSVVKVAGNHTLIAKWTANEHYVYIEENNVDVTVIRNDTGSEVTSGSKVPYGTSLSISCSANSGYSNPNCTYNGETISMPDNDLSISSSADKNPSCLLKGTPIVLGDGNTIAIEKLRIGDEILCFDHRLGEYVETKVIYTYKAFDCSSIITLFFESDVSLSIVNSHGLYDTTMDEYVLITPGSIANYIGHGFAYCNYIDGHYVNKNLMLLDYTIEKKYVERYDIVTENSLNHIASGLLSCSDTLVGFMNVFEFKEKLYDETKMNEDIATFGLFDYEPWAEFVSEEEFNAFKGSYFKIAIEKGLLSTQQLFSLINDLRTMWVG